MNYTVYLSARFKKSFEKAKKRGLPIDKLKDIVAKLKQDIPLEQKFHDHEIKGNLKGTRECHINHDWLLLYKKNGAKLILTLTDTGTHSDLFKK